MKLSAIHLFAIVQIYLMIEQTSSAIFFDIGNSPRVAQYTRLRDASKQTRIQFEFLKP